MLSTLLTNEIDVGSILRLVLMWISLDRHHSLSVMVNGALECFIIQTGIAISSSEIML